MIEPDRNLHMSTLTPGRTRTITGYVSQLLEYPRWYIERDIDFTYCDYHGVFDATIERCTSCKFGTGCRWLNTTRSPTTNDASLPELVNALQAAVDYLGEHCQHEQPCRCEACAWIHEARALLRSSSHWT